MQDVTGDQQKLVALNGPHVSQDNITHSRHERVLLEAIFELLQKAAKQSKRTELSVKKKTEPRASCFDFCFLQLRSDKFDEMACVQLKAVLNRLKN